MVMRAVRTERMRSSNFVSFRRYLIRRHAYCPTPGFDPSLPSTAPPEADAQYRLFRASFLFPPLTSPIPEDLPRFLVHRKKALDAQFL